MAVSIESVCSAGNRVRADGKCAQCGSTRNQPCGGAAAYIERRKIEEDAARYRWLRNAGGWVCHADPHKMDAEIDAARFAEYEKQREVTQ